MARLRNLRPDAPVVRNILSSLAEGANSETDRVNAVARLRANAAGLSDAATRLRDLIRAHDAVELINSVAVPASMGFAGEVDDAPLTTTWDAKIEYLHALALSGPRGTGDVSEELTAEMLRLLSDVFDAAQAELMARMLDEKPDGSVGVQQASVQARLEALNDRMAGYAPHLQRIDEEVFGRHRDFYVKQLGFNPGDVVRLVRDLVAHSNRSMARATALMNGARKPNSSDEKVVEAMKAFVDTLNGTTVWSPVDLGTFSGIEPVEIEAILVGMSASFGSQPDFLTPFDESVARTRPVVPLDNGTWLAPLPWSLAHEVHSWMQTVAGANPTLSQRYRDHRAKATERMVSEILRDLFGDALVFQSQHYDSVDGHGEIDVLVAGHAALCFECKSHSLTPSGRAGHRQRIRRVAGDVVDSAFEQTSRAAAYIRGGGRSFADREGDEGALRLPIDVGNCLEVVVTFERMDPLTTAPLDLVGQPGRRIWMVCLADLLMVTEILDDPATFLDYVRIRAEVTALGLHTIMEGDCLGLYLHDRMVEVRQRLARDPGYTLMLGYHSSAINEYFTENEAGAKSPKPRRGVPVDVLRALGETYEPSREWAQVAQAVAELDPIDWKPWKQFSRKSRLDRRFNLPPTEAGLIAIGERASASFDARRRELHVPRYSH